MQSLSMSNKMISNKMKKLNLYTILFYLAMFAFDLCFLLSIISYDSIPFLNKPVMYKMMTLYWEILIANYITLYVNLKSVLCIGMVGCRISVLIRIYNNIHIFLIYFTKSQYICKPRTVNFVIYMVASAIEIVISVVYKIKSKAESALFSFKSIGANRHRIRGSSIENSVKLVLEVLFAKDCSTFINNFSYCNKKAFWYSLINFIASCLTIALVRVALENKSKKLTRICYFSLIINVILTVIRFLYPIANLKVSMCDAFKVFAFSEKIFLFALLCKYLKENEKLQLIFQEEKKNPKRLGL